MEDGLTVCGFAVVIGAVEVIHDGCCCAFGMDVEPRWQ